MKTKNIYIIGTVIIVFTISITLFLVMEDIANQPTSNTITGGTTISSILLAIRTFNLWQKIMQVFWLIVTILAIVFILCGIGICLGF